MTRPLFEEVELIFPVQAVPKPRDGHQFGFGKSNKHKNFRPFINDLNLRARQQWPHGVLAFPLSLDVDLWVQGGHRELDIDNLLGGVLDALQGVVYTSDSYVDEVKVRRFWNAEHGGIVVRVRPLTPAPKKSTVSECRSR